MTAKGSETQQPAAQTRHEQPSREDLQPQIVDIELAPAFLVDNRFLLTGYRKNFRKMRDVLRSLFLPHNETLNTWTHLLGAAIILLLLWTIVADHLPHGSIKEHIGEVTAAKEDFHLELSALQQQVGNCSATSSHDAAASQLQLCRYIDILRTDRHSAHFSAAHDSVSQLVFDKSGPAPHQHAAVVEYLFRLLHLDELSESLEVWPVVFHLLSTFVCMAGSFSFHWFGCKSPRIYQALRRVDMSSVNVAMIGSFLPLTYYMFYCHDVLSRLYSTVQVASFFLLQTFFLQDWFYRAESLKRRTNTFVVFGFVTAAPCVHGFVASFWSSRENDYIPAHRFFGHLVFCALLVLIGVQFYKYKFPERVFPRRFDIYLNSHTIWHLFSLAGLYFQHMSVLSAYRLRLVKKCRAGL